MPNASSGDSSRESVSPPQVPTGSAKAAFVQQLFNRIAPRYDRLNDCISLGLHRRWKARACQLLELSAGSKVLDVCTGTGDLARRLAACVGPTGHVIGLDFSEAMLDVARQRFPQAPARMEWVQGDAMALPYEANHFDGAIVAFGLRNVSDVAQAISEMVRVVKPGAWVVTLDTNPVPRLPGFWWYFEWVMPAMGRWLAGDPAAYGYLRDSTKTFLSPEAMAEAFRSAGLVDVETVLQAFGAAAIVRGCKAL
jgi:demethylmenaquinone methyltransferase/2-methoxy-6-polyprenyl-1,4-benzoquinol methylase